MMSWTRIRMALWAMLTLLSVCFPAWAQQSENNALHAVPLPDKVVVDGKLDDWDLSGQIEVFANYRTRSTFSAKVAAMYDKDHFYLSVQWRDASPMFNMNDANFDIGSGWKSDCLQLRLKTDMVISDISCWYSTAAQRPVVNISYGSYAKGPENNSNFNALQDATKNGVQEAFQMGEDGKSYTQEIAFPWKLITAQSAIVKATGAPYKSPTTYKAGDTFYMGMEFLWGGSDGRTWPIHRYADLLKAGSTSREFFWTAENAWGPVILGAQGKLNLPQPDYTALMGTTLQKTQGPVKLAYTMPFDGFATIVIEDEQGRRVKNLIGMAPRSKGAQIDYWDGTGEDGKLVAPGNYRWRGLVHQGIDPVYEATYGTAGNPGWDIGNGTGAWLSDHKPPRAVATGKNVVVLGADEAESGWSLICTDLNGQRKWGERKFHGIVSLAVDDKYVYAIMAPWGNPTPPKTIGRLELKTGKYAPFASKPEPQLQARVLKDGENSWIPAIAVNGDRLAVPLSALNIVRFFNKDTMEIVGELPVPGVGVVTYDATGTLYVYSDKKIVKVVNNTLVPVAEIDFWPNDLAVDGAGRIFAANREKHQVAVYDKDGSLLRMIGREGGRQVPGKWVLDAMRNPTALDVDSLGRLWVAEEDMTPKRVSVWSVEGALLKEFIGPTTYGGTGACVDPDDKTRVFGVGCEFKLDYAKNESTVVAALGPAFSGDWFKIDGRKYFMTKNGDLYLRVGDGLRHVAKMTTTSVKDFGAHKNYQLPPAPKGTHGYASLTYIWMDRNDDGEPQAEEIVSGSRWGGWNELKYPVGVAGYFGSFWLDDQFNLYGYASESYGSIGGRGPFVTKTPLKEWTPGGAPIWDFAKQQVVSDAVKGGALFLPADGMVIVGAPLTGIRDDGTVMWTYKDNWQGVHASHNAPIPDRDDLLVGTLGCIGKANLPAPFGKVFAMHSNMGRMYLMTTDGLFIASVFQDVRLGSDAWPDTARPGAPLGGVTMGSEWFGGYFFKSEATNEYYLIAGGTSYNLIKLQGFDSLQPLKPTEITFTAKDLQAAETLLQQRVAQSAEKKALTIARAATAPAIDGKLDEYAKDSFVEWTSGTYKVRAALAADAQRLYLAYDVSGDQNPMVNGGKEHTQLFVTGDSVDLQLGTNSAADVKRAGSTAGDLRLLISVLDGKPVAVLYRWNVKGAKNPVTFVCPWRSHTVDSVELLQDAQVNITRRNGGYIVEASVPLATLGFAPQTGKQYKLDLGAIFSDAKGDNRAARVYWSNKATGLTADVPGEIMATPNLWGTAQIAE